MSYVLSRLPEVGIGQPPGDLILNRGHPLAKGLILSCYNAVSDMEKPPRNYVTGVTGSRNAVRSYGPAIGANPYFASSSFNQSADSARRTHIINAAKFNGSTSWAFIDLDLSPYSVITFALWMAVLTATDSVALEYTANYLGHGMSLDPNGTDGTNTGVVVIDGFGNSSNYSQRTSGVPTIGEMHHYIIVDRRNATWTTHDWYIDGCASVPVTFGTGITGTSYAANGGLNIGARNKGASVFSNIAIACLQIWNRALSVDEAHEYYSNSWGFLRPAVIGLPENS